MDLPTKLPHGYTAQQTISEGDEKVVRIALKKGKMYLVLTTRTHRYIPGKDCLQQLQLNRHRNVMPFLQTFKTTFHTHTVLSPLQVENTLLSIRQPNLVNCFLDILSGLEHIHSLNIFHRQISPENIICNGGCIKLTNFEYACNVDLVSDECGFIYYTAPEALVCTQPYSAKGADVWSLGAVFYYLLMQKDPFKCNTLFPGHQYPLKRHQYLLTSKPQFTCSMEAQDLVLKMIKPSNRIPLNEVKEHSFFSAVLDKENLLLNKITKTAQGPASFVFGSCSSARQQTYAQST